jgi:hypothetical protein
MKTGVFSMRCCTGDGGAGRRLSRWPSVVALQEEATNHPKVRRSRAVRAERCGKSRAFERGRYDPMKANESKPQMTCRNALDDIKNGYVMWTRDEPGGCLFIGQVVSGMEVARAWPGLWCGTWEPVVSRSRATSGAVLARGRIVEARTPSSGSARGRVAMRSTGADCLVVAVKPGNAGGAKGAGHPGLLSGQP